MNSPFLQIKICWNWILNLAEVIDKLACSWLCLSEFQFDAVHWAGIKNHAADALLWLETGGTDSTELDNDL